MTEVNPIHEDNNNNKIQIEFWVSPNGDDLAEGTAQSPFKTIERARDEVRKLNGDMQGDIVVYLKGGMYAIDQTIKFDTRDTATNGYKVSYVAVEGEMPIISGGRCITGWEKYDDNGIYKTNVGQLRFRQLYVNDHKAIRARTPNVGDTYERTQWDRSHNDLRLVVDTHKVADLSKLNQVEIIVFSHWAESYIQLSGCEAYGETGKSIVSIRDKEKEILINRGFPMLREGDPYYFENALEFLDVDNEWYLDDETGDLYYKPEEGKNIEDLEIMAPQVETLVEVKGTREELIENLEFKGISFKYSTWLRPNTYGQLDTQAGQYNIKTVKPNEQWIGRPQAAVYVSYTDHFRFEKNRLKNTGATAIDLHYGTRNSMIQGNKITDSAGNGMTIGVFSEEDCEFHIPYKPEDARDVCVNETIANNYIARIGTDYQGTIGIACGFPQGITIEHNEITDTPYTGISLGWSWTTEASVLSDNVIQYNKIHNVLRTLSDGGAIYTLSKQPNSQMMNNYIYDIKLDPATQPAPVCGIFMDEGTSGFDVKNNVIIQMGEGTRRIFNNVSSNPSTDVQGVIEDVVARAGLSKDYRDIAE